MPRFLPLPLVGYGVSLTFTVSLRSPKSGSLAITLSRTFPLFPNTFYLYLRMTGRYLMPFCKKPFFISAHACPFRRLTPPLSPTSGDSSRLIFFQFLLTFAPIINLSVDTLAKAKRLTHFYSVALLLEKWFACFPCPGTAYVSYSFLLQQTRGDSFLYESFSHFVFLYKNYKFFLPWSFASPALGGKCRALRGDRGMFAYTGQNVMAKQKQLCRHS